MKALAGVDLSVDKGEIHSLIGENGSGKSTLIKIMAGVLQPDRGTILIDGESYSHVNPLLAIRKGIQVIYQDFSLFPNLTVAENLALNTEHASGRRFFSRKEVHATAGKALAQLGVEIDRHLRVEELSVAQQQLVAISRALVQKARLIIMDEPTSALTYREVQSLFRVIRDLKERRVSVLFVSHKLEEVLTVSDRIAVLRGGQKVAEGNPETLDASLLVEHMTGRRLESRSRKSPIPLDQEDPLLQVEGLTRRGSYRNISFELEKGRILGISGLLGSGQGHLALGLFGLLPADSGSISINGTPLRIKKVADALSAGIGFVPSDRLMEGLFLNQSIERNLQANRLDDFTELMGILNKYRMRSESLEWVRKLGISLRALDDPVRTLSGGNQQKVILARWLSRVPRILILHNPTSGVDVASKHDIHQLIRDHAAGGTGILVISDDLPEILETCDRIILMKKGEISDELSPVGLTENQLMERIMA